MGENETQMDFVLINKRQTGCEAVPSRTRTRVGCLGNVVSYCIGGGFI